jgi:hypothetical protein
LWIDSAPEYHTVKARSPIFDPAKLNGASDGLYRPSASSLPFGAASVLTNCGQLALLSCASPPLRSKT